jgi:hypothetical protein
MADTKAKNFIELKKKRSTNKIEALQQKNAAAHQIEEDLIVLFGWVKEKDIEGVL